MSYYEGTERQQEIMSRASIGMSKVPLPPSVVKGKRHAVIMLILLLTLLGLQRVGSSS